MKDEDSSVPDPVPDPVPDRAPDRAPDRDETIMALASAAGRAGVAVVRVSGPLADRCVTRLTGRPVPPPRYAAYRRLSDPADGRLLDTALVLRFPAPHSFTGEDVVEFHIHGGRAVLDTLLDALGREGLRLAEPGEFSRRAFQNGKMDLTQAEAIADLVDAETEAQRRQALHQAEGGLSRLYGDWRDRALRMTALLEAWLDFPDEDLPDDVLPRVRSEMAALQGEIRAHLALADQGERVRDGVHVVLAGAPNAGKSTLLNLLAGREAAIVSATPGTTRDVVELALNLGGFAVYLSDTAGLRHSDNAVEQEGVRRARARYTQADIRLWIADATVAPIQALPPDDLPIKPDLVVYTKIDLNRQGSTRMTQAGSILLSSKTGEGVEAFRHRLTGLVRDIAHAAAPPPNRQRHRDGLRAAAAALERALAAPTLELMAEDLRQTIHAFGKLTGRVDVEDVLDIVFREFCIGK